MKKNNILKINILTIFLVMATIIIVIIGFTILKKCLNNKDIIKYELQTHEYFDKTQNTNKYFIDSEQELNNFYSIYSNMLNINKDYLNDNSIFIQVKQVESGSVKLKLSSVSFDNNTVNFIIDENLPEIGTMDMAFWYFVAIIPNEKLNNLNIDNWRKPTEVLKKTDDKIIDINNYNFELNSENKYTIITDMRWKTMQNDGGSYTSVYYQIDLDNNIISKIEENFEANLGGTTNTKKSIIYTKNIESNIKEDIKLLLEEIITKQDINENNNYNFFTILNMNIEKEIFNTNSIEKINNLLNRIDELKK